MMPREALFAIGAGLASATAAMAFLSGVFMAMGLVYLAPLPMLMVGLAYGPRAAATAALAGIMAMGVFGGPLMASIFAIVHALPAWMIVKLALMTRSGQPKERSEENTSINVAAVPDWLTPGQMISAMAFFAAGLMIASVVSVGDGGLSGFVAGHLEQVLGQMAPGLDGADRERMAQAMTPLFPGAVATSWVIMAVVNTVTAQGILVRMSQNRRPSPSYLGLELPSWISWPLVGAAVLALVGPGEWEYIGRNLTMVLALPYFFLGLAVFHTLARRVTATKPLLVAFYLVIVISIWATVVVAGIGVVEQWFGLRHRIQPGPANNDLNEE